MSNLPTINFTQDSPFFEMVMAFLAATEGIRIFEKEDQPASNADKIDWYRGKVKPDLVIDMGQIHALRLSGDLTADTMVKSLCGMLLCTAYTVADAHNDQSLSSRGIVTFAIRQARQLLLLQKRRTPGPGPPGASS